MAMAALWTITSGCLWTAWHPKSYRQHKETLSAMRAGDAEKAARAIREDVIQGMEQVRHVMTQT